ncbi:MAG: hypothetical protein HQL12_07315 [Candidatus Omnitrophica bacterium]|nr:hypothetical protein [Candidatus Omnitrophota bacterium]
MKKIVLTLCVFVGSIASAWADDLAMAATMMDSSQTILSGVVKSVSWADPAKGTKSEIVVIDADKKTIHILVTSTTTLWDADAKPLLPDKIVANGHVNVIYLTTPEGVNIGKSIKILK